MEYFIKIKALNESLIIANNILNKVSENSYLCLKCKLNFQESFVLEVEPIKNENKLLLPYKIFIQENNGTLKIESSNIEVLNYKNHYFITLKTLEVAKNLTILKSDKDYLIFNTSITNVTTKTKTISLPKLFSAFSTKKIDSNLVFCFENESEKYALILNNEEIIFNDYYSKINLENKIEILSSVYDIAKHAILTKIENKTITQKIVYEKNQPKITTCKQTIPLAFLQALKIGNIKLCNSYLSTNLREISSLEMLKIFFGEFKKIEFINNLYILFYCDNTHKAFSFEIENNKITKINNI